MGVIAFILRCSATNLKPISSSGHAFNSHAPLLHFSCLFSIHPYFYSYIQNKVCDRLFMGSQDAAANYIQLHDKGVSHILNVGYGETACPGEFIDFYAPLSMHHDLRARTAIRRHRLLLSGQVHIQSGSIVGCGRNVCGKRVYGT